MKAMVIAIGLVVAATPARADLRSLTGAAWLHEDVTYQRRISGAGAPGDGLVLAGVQVRGMVGGAAGYLIGVDLAAGSTVPGGFAYHAALYPIGLGIPLGRVGTVGVALGVGASGAVGTVDDALIVPLAGAFEVGVGRRLRLLGRARAQWVAAAPSRDDGARVIGWADEVDAMVGVRLGRRYDDYGFRSGNGYFLGLTVGERGGARMVGATFGYAIDMNNQP